MGLSVQRESGEPWPVLTCDKCGKPIKDWNFAIITYQLPSENSVMPAKVYHKSEFCDPGRGKDGSVLWEELKNYIPWLLWNQDWGTRGTNSKGATLTINVPKTLDW